MIGNATFIAAEQSDILKDKELHYLRERVKHFETETSKNVNENKVSYMQISELVTKFQELQDEKVDLETRFTTENVRFFELVEKLRDRLRLIALSTLEMESKIRILNNKVPELEEINGQQNKNIDELTYKLRTANIKEIKTLEKNIKNTEHSIKGLENEILKIKKKNTELKTEIDALTQESIDSKIKFEKEEEALRDSISRLEHDNSVLENKLDKLVDVNKETYMQKIHSLEKELDALATQIKRMRSDKISLVDEMSSLKKEVKKLVLKQVATENGQL